MSGDRQFVCPGERVPISDQIHRARMRAGFAACRRCPFAAGPSGTDSEGASRADSGTKPDRTLAAKADVWGAETLCGRLHRDLTIADLERVAAAFAAELWSRPRCGATEQPIVAVGIGERRLEPLLANRIIRRLITSGCQVTEIGRALPSVTQYAVDHLDAAGGIHVSAGDAPAGNIGIRFFGAAGAPISSGAGLERIAAATAAGPARPSRKGGRSASFHAEVPYEAGLLKMFRDLRSMTIVLATGSTILLRAAQRLSMLSPLAIRGIELPPWLSREEAAKRLALEIKAEGAAFGLFLAFDTAPPLLVADDGMPVSPLDLLRLVLKRPRSRGELVLEWSWRERAAGLASSAGLDPVPSNPTFAAMAGSMRDHHAALGFDREGRLWFPDPVPSPAAIPLLAELAAIVGRHRAPLSEIFRRDVLLAG